jgi:putative redox protein
MRVSLRLEGEAFHFVGENELGRRVDFDASPDIGGQDAGVRPMQAMLMSMGACSAIDAVMILRKQRQRIDRFAMTLDADRKVGGEPAPFTRIHFTFHLTGEIALDKATRAAELAMTKYCSALASLHPDIPVTFGIDLTPA